MTVCYFSATGNCMYIAKRIGGRQLSIPQLMKQNSIEIEDDKVGIIAPVYAGEMPMMVKSFIEKACLRTDYLFFIYTYGMGYGQAFFHVKQVCEQKGLTLSYINAVQMVDNYLPGFEMQNQIDTLPQKNVEGQLEKVLADIADGKTVQLNQTAAGRAQMAMYKRMLAQRILKKDTAQGYIVNDNCIRCGICAKVCPANNITVTDKVHFANRCEVCYACLQNCPQNAIHMKEEKSAMRFRNEHIKLQEIIEANE